VIALRCEQFQICDCLDHIRNIEHFVILAITKMKCLLHPQNINFENKVDYGHQIHPAKRNVDLGLVLGQHLVLFQNFGYIDFVLIKNLDCPIKGQGICSVKTM
jgi:hypothetical protein